MTATLEREDNPLPDGLTVHVLYVYEFDKANNRHLSWTMAQEGNIREAESLFNDRLRHGYFAYTRTPNGSEQVVTFDPARLVTVVSKPLQGG